MNRQSLLDSMTPYSFLVLLFARETPMCGEPGGDHSCYEQPGGLLGRSGNIGSTDHLMQGGRNTHGTRDGTGCPSGLLVRVTRVLGILWVSTHHPPSHQGLLINTQVKLLIRVGSRQQRRRGGDQAQLVPLPGIISLST